MTIAKAIQKINPTAQFSYNDENINTITWHNGTPPIPKDQILAMIPVVEQEIVNKKIQEEQDKQSAISKLKALGLNDAEIKAIIGI